MYFESFVCGLDKFFLSIIFSFSIKGKRNFYANVVLFFFLLGVFFIHCEYGIGLKVDGLVNQIRSDYSGNLSRVDNVADYLSVIDQYQFLLHICILVGVMFHLLQDKI